MSIAVGLAAAAGAFAGAGIVDLTASLAQRPRRHRRWSVVGLVGRLGQRVGAPAASPDLTDRLAAAGDPLAIADVMALKTGGALAGLLAAAPLAAATPGRIGLVVAAAAATAGFIAPDAWLGRRIRARAATMADEMADVLDLVRVATDAGLPVRRALREVGRRHPGTLARELARAADQLDLGVPRRVALENLRRRLPLPAAAALHAALDGAERLGTPPSEALGALAADARAERTRGYAERAARAAPKVQLVVALVLVPSVLLLIAAALLPALGV